MDDTRTALVVGGSRGIGRAIALRLARDGFDIWLTYRSDAKAAEETAAGVRGLERKCELFCFDVADHKATQDALSARAQETPPYAVVFNAGIARDNLLFWMPKADWDAVIQTDLGGFYNLMQAVLAPMLAARKGRIVAISSLSGEIGHAGQVNYSAAKAGLIGAAKALAREVGARNVLVNVVSPGVIDTDMTADSPVRQLLPSIPLRRFGRPEEVASLVGYLCSEPDMYMHGQVLSVNGGLSMS
jgi:3-oxoacyl-[acyl-carrier protein] reductase